jgi:hypothetical protein
MAISARENNSERTIGDEVRVDRVGLVPANQTNFHNPSRQWLLAKTLSAAPPIACLRSADRLGTVVPFPICNPSGSGEAA